MRELTNNYEKGLLYYIECDTIENKRMYVLILEDAMKISYKKLWKLLIDREMMKKDLAEKAGISNASIAKLGRNENVNTDILLKICIALKCEIADILEIVSDESKK